MPRDTVTAAATPAGSDRRLLVEALRRIEQLNAAAAAGPTGAGRTAEPIAIIGLGCRLPGGVSDPDGYWRLLRDGVDATSEFPAERGDATALLDPDPDAPGKAYVVRGGFVGTVDRFEPGAFGISPREAVGMDPQHRLILEVVWEALERAGYAPDSLGGSATGVFLGVSTTDYVRTRQDQGDIRDVDGYQLIGEPAFTAGRVSYTLGLTGPSQVVDTTCSSSLVALHDACRSLRLGECDLALAGGVNLMLTPFNWVLLSKFRALSPDGRCKTFDAAADGYARGEGAGVVVLKRLSDAVAAGDNVVAVVRGSAVNHDGRSSGISVPSPTAQQAVIQAALTQAGLEPAQIDYVEAHGTGTALGDPIELRALQAALGRHRPAGDPLLVGSVKTNIGHLESAAGIAGLLKLVLSLQHRQIPPHLHLRVPNPNVDWDALNVEVVTANRPWPAAAVRTGAISSFGASGTNAHVIVSEPPAPPVPPEAAAPALPDGRTHVLMLSGRSAGALRTMAGQYAAALRSDPALTAGDVAFTSHVGRSRSLQGIAVAGRTTAGMADALESFGAGQREDRTVAASLAPPRQRKVAWLFTGQGSQYPRMGENLRAEPAYAAAIQEVAGHLDPLIDEPLATLLGRPAAAGDPTGASSSLHRTGSTQPALFAVEYALARLWQSWGVVPAAVMGHSVGEIAAATVAGVMDLPDACRLVAARARLMQSLPSGGVMVTVVCDETTAEAAIAGYRESVSIAAVNGPSDTVLSGTAQSVAAITATLQERGIKHRPLTVSHAFHSPLMAPVLAELRAVAASISYRTARIPLISNLTGAAVGPGEIDAGYWVRHAQGTVRFADGLRALYQDGFRTFLEIGPQPVLSGLGARSLDDNECRFVPSLRRGLDDEQSVVLGLGALHLRGVTVDWAAHHRHDQVRRVPLPTYPWEGESYWFTPAAPVPAGVIGEPVPGAGLRLDSARPTYRLDLSHPHWAEHAGDEGRPVATGCLLDAALAAAIDGLNGSWAGVGEVATIAPLPLDAGRTVNLSLTEEDTGATFEVRSTSAAEAAFGDSWRLHLRGRIRRRPGLKAVPASTFTNRSTLGQRSGPGSLAAVLDAAAAALTGEVPTAGEPVTAIAELVCPDPAAIRRIETSAPARADFYGAQGEWLGGVLGLEVASPLPEPEPWRDPDELLLDLVWQPAGPAAATGPESLAGADILLIAGPGEPGDPADPGDRFATALTAAGASCTLIRPGLTDPGDDEGGTLFADALADLLKSWRATRADQSEVGTAETAGSAGSRPAPRIVLLTGLDAPGPDSTDATTLLAHRDRAELLAVGVLQALADAAGDEAVQVTLVTRGGVSTGEGQRNHTPAAAPLWGLGRVIALEHPQHWGGCIDLDPDSADLDPAALANALTWTGTEDQQALRGTGRLIARIVPARPAPGDLRREIAVRPDGSYLITGAFGGIGQEVARWLARRGAGRLVLLGRTRLPDRDDWDRTGLGEAVRERIGLVRELEDLGTEVTVVAADVADAEAMAELVTGPAAGPDVRLAGVVHAAGVSGPQFVREVDRPGYDRVWRPKVLGGWALHRATEHLSLDFFLGFSSIAATWGSQHLTSYAAGNAFLDGLAHHRRARGLPALTIAWSSWELESALFDGEIAAFLSATGLRPLSAPQSLRLMSALLDGAAAYRIVCSANWPLYRSILQARADRPVLRDLELAGDPEPDPGRPAAAIQGAVLAAPPQQRLPLLDGYVREQLAQLLRLPRADLAGEFHLLDLGLDSLMVMELIARSRKDLGVEFTSPDFFATDANLWAAFLLSRVEERFPDAGPGTTRTATDQD